MGSRRDSTIRPGSGALAILARIIAHEILRKAMDGNRCLEVVPSADRGASEIKPDKKR